MLDVGSGSSTIMQKTFPQAEVIRLDADPDCGADVTLDITSEAFLAWEPEPFDLIWMSHVLEHIELRKVREVLKKLASLLKPDGELHVKVPSLEWAAEQILWERNLPVALFHIYGSQQSAWQHHWWGYTLATLRAELTAAGLATGATARGTYQIGYNGKTYDAEELYVVGVRRGDEVNESAA